MRILSRALLVLVLHSSLAAAGDSGELQALYNALNMLDQEQQAIYAQFQMVQILRDNALRYYIPSLLPEYMGTPPNFDDNVAAQRNAIERSEELSREANRLLSRYQAIEAKKQPLQQKIYKLTLNQ